MMIESLSLAFMALYATFIIYMIGVAWRFPQPSTINAAVIHDGISIVIPVKNEEYHLSHLIDGLAKQDFPAGMEILFIDDGSDDSTVAVIKKESQTCPVPVRCISGRFDPQKKLTSKQQAIDLGIREASFPLIALTDADMSLSRNWLSVLSAAIKPRTDLVYGHTAILPDGNAFAWFQSFQLEVLFSIAALFHYAGIAGSCMGNNILLRKSAYLECGGHEKIGYCITEDRALLRHFRKHGRMTAITAPFYPNAITEPQRSLAQFYRQIVRWARGGFTNGIGLLILGTVFAAQNAIALLSVTGILGSATSLASLFVFLLTWLLIAIMFNKNRSPVNSIGFPPFYLLLLIETIILISALIVPVKVVWKGRRV